MYNGAKRTVAAENINGLIDKYKSTVYGIALSRLGSKEDADDVFQEVFLALFRKNMSFESEDREKYWIIRTTINQCKKLSLSSWSRKTVPMEDMQEQTGFFESREENAVFCAVTELPEKYRTVIYLYYFEEFSAEEIGKILKVRAATVRMRLTRARTMLKSKLKGDYFYE